MRIDESGDFVGNRTALPSLPAKFGDEILRDHNGEAMFDRTNVAILQNAHHASGTYNSGNIDVSPFTGVSIYVTTQRQIVIGAAGGFSMAGIKFERNTRRPWEWQHATEQVLANYNQWGANTAEIVMHKLPNNKWRGLIRTTANEFIGLMTITSNESGWWWIRSDQHAEHMSVEVLGW